MRHVEGQGCLANSTLIVKNSHALHNSPFDLFFWKIQSAFYFFSTLRGSITKFNMEILYYARVALHAVCVTVFRLTPLTPGALLAVRSPPFAKVTTY
jgi:hypothetical protein